METARSSSRLTGRSSRSRRRASDKGLEDAPLRRWLGGVDTAALNQDLAKDRITVLLDHLSEFALLGPVERVYLPLVMRGY